MDSTEKKSNDRYLFISLLILIAWLPFPYASVQPWAYTLFETITFFLLTAWLSLFLSNNTKPIPTIIIDNKLPLLLLTAWLLYHLIQIIPLPSGIIGIINPSAKNIYDYAQLGESDSFLTLSISPSSTLDSFLKNTAYIALFFLVLVLTNTRQRLKQLAWLVFAVGAIQSLYSLINFFTNGQFSLVDSLPPWNNTWTRSVRGTYSHYNHFAGLLILTIPIGLGLYFAYIKQQTESLLKKNKTVSALDFLMSEKPLFALICILMITTLIYTGSRGGNGAFILAFIITSLILIFHLGLKSKESKYLITILLLMVISVGWVGMGLLEERLKKQGLAQSQRDVMRADTYTLISNYPIFGTGSFKDIYPMYIDKEIGGNPMNVHTHMEYLEMLADKGIIGFTLLGLALALFGKRIVKKIKTNKDPLIRGMLFASIMGTSAALIHAFVDHNFQITANAAYFFVLLAIGVIASFLPDKKKIA